MTLTEEAKAKVEEETHKLVAAIHQAATEAPGWLHDLVGAGMRVVSEVKKDPEAQAALAEIRQAAGKLATRLAEHGAAELGALATAIGRAALGF